MIKVNRIAYASFNTPDLEAQVDHYARVMGLSVTLRDKDTVYLSSGADHHTVVLGRNGEAGCNALGFQLPPDTDLDAYEAQIRKHGIETTRLSDAQPGIASIIAFEDPKGTRIETFVEARPSGAAVGTSGIAPNKLGHVAFNVRDIKGAVDFYCDILGFKVSDWMGDFFAFLRCGPDHHTINLVTGERDKMHHIAFELRDWTHIRDACDLLSRDKVPLVWGPVRHGIGHNISIYHRNPDGQIIESFCELDRVNEALDIYEPRITHQEFPQRGKVWTDIGLAANMWGTPPPDGFLD